MRVGRNENVSKFEFQLLCASAASRMNIMSVDFPRLPFQKLLLIIKGPIFGLIPQGIPSVPGSCERF